MSRKLISILSLTVLTLIPFASEAQVEKSSAEQLRDGRRRLSEAIKDSNGVFKVYLEGLSRKGTDKAVLNAVRVFEDIKKLPAKPEYLVCYNVPAMSELQRLPDAYPLDGDADSPLRIISAIDEYEAGSFVIYPFSDLGKVKISISELKNANGKVFPAKNLDMKVVKVWYQNKNGWYSYFADTGLKLTPELLLNDEDLIRVDTDEEANYARETTEKGVNYRWITPYRELDSRYDEFYRKYCTFSPMKKEFADAETLQPVTLNAGEFKQMFVTAHVTKDIEAGNYKGEIVMTQANKIVGKMPVSLKVLPFTLPAPKTYYDVEKDFYTSMYNYLSYELIMDENGGDLELAKKQFYKILENQKAHNQMMHWIRGSMDTEVREQIAMLKKIGMTTDPLLGGLNVKGNNKFEMRNHARTAKKWFKDILGHSNVFIGHGDEPGASWVMNSRPVFKIYQEEGFKFIIAGNDVVFYKAGYIYDFFNIAKNPEDGSTPALWNQIDNHAWVAWYATHHVGPENPAYNRRQYGMAPYLANYSAICNYAHHLGPYNDRSETYKPMVFAYGQYNGVIDTLAWEGFREGVDDIRYATLLKQLATKASGAKNLDVVYAGRKALQMFVEIENASTNLNMLRLEMINHILKLQSMLEKNK